MATNFDVVCNSIETHPWRWYVPQNSSTLMIGTFPSARKNWKYDFFYPNPLNLFWKVMAEIANQDLRYFSENDAVTERKEILKKLGIAITDMGYRIIRDGNSSLDEKLMIVEYMDIFKILIENPTINKLVFTSSSGKVSASKWFLEYLKTKNIICSFPSGKKPVRSHFVFNDRKIDLVILYSPSRRASNRISFQRLVEMYQKEING